MLKNTKTGFGSIAKFLHWILAILMIMMVLLGLFMKRMPSSELKWFFYDDIHKPTGLVIFALVVLRLTWRVTNVQPDLPDTLTHFQKFAAKMNYVLLYLLMFGIPISGFFLSTLANHPISFYGLFKITPLAEKSPWSELASTSHTVLSYILIVAFILHVSAALRHQFFLKDNLLKRMF